MHRYYMVVVYKDGVEYDAKTFSDRATAKLWCSHIAHDLEFDIKSQVI